MDLEALCKKEQKNVTTATAEDILGTEMSFERPMISISKCLWLDTNEITRFVWNHYLSFK